MASSSLSPAPSGCDLRLQPQLCRCSWALAPEDLPVAGEGPRDSHSAWREPPPPGERGLLPRALGGVDSTLVGTQGTDAAVETLCELGWASGTAREVPVWEGL